jgi:hypothetical protein
MAIRALSKNPLESELNAAFQSLRMSFLAVVLPFVCLAIWICCHFVSVFVSVYQRGCFPFSFSARVFCLCLFPDFVLII